jgi:hypothetical protein
MVVMQNDRDFVDVVLVYPEIQLQIHILINKEHESLKVGIGYIRNIKYVNCNNTAKCLIFKSQINTENVKKHLLK